MPAPCGSRTGSSRASGITPSRATSARHCAQSRGSSAPSARPTELLLAEGIAAIDEAAAAAGRRRAPRAGGRLALGPLLAGALRTQHLAVVADHLDAGLAAGA